MLITRQDLPHATVFAVEGKVDLQTSRTLREQLRPALQASAAVVVIDLTAVPFMDSSGLTVLIEAKRGTEHYGGQLRLCGLSATLRELFRITGLTASFDIRATRAEALA
ncbi:MAG: STAS domain-containing protein [Planctomycetia bacterium]